LEISHTRTFPDSMFLHAVRWDSPSVNSERPTATLCAAYTQGLPLLPLPHTLLQGRGRMYPWDPYSNLPDSRILGGVVCPNHLLLSGSLLTTRKRDSVVLCISRPQNQRWCGHQSCSEWAALPFRLAFSPDACAWLLRGLTFGPRSLDVTRPRGRESRANTCIYVILGTHSRPRGPVGECILSAGSRYYVVLL
jgi:hypothetical protein